jgi:hypothetical protein
MSSFFEVRVIWRQRRPHPSMTKAIPRTVGELKRRIEELETEIYQVKSLEEIQAHQTELLLLFMLLERAERSSKKKKSWLN